MPPAMCWANARFKTCDRPRTGVLEKRPGGSLELLCRDRSEASEMVPEFPRALGGRGPRVTRRSRDGAPTVLPSCIGSDGGKPMARRPGTAAPSMLVGTMPADASMLEEDPSRNMSKRTVLVRPPC